jgi:hypothetical protein
MIKGTFHALRMAKKAEDFYIFRLQSSHLLLSFTAQYV